MPGGMAAPEDVETAISISELGQRHQILELLHTAIPDLDLSDPTWGILDGDGYSIEFNIGADDPLDAIMLHVRGDDRVITVIQHLCEQTGWRAIDIGNGRYIDFAHEPTAGLQIWRTNRDQLIKSFEAKGQHTIPDAKVEGKRLDAITMSRQPQEKKWWEFWK